MANICVCVCVCAVLGRKCGCAFDEIVNVLVKCFVIDMWVLCIFVHVLIFISCSVMGSWLVPENVGSSFVGYA